MKKEIKEEIKRNYLVGEGENCALHFACMNEGVNEEVIKYLKQDKFLPNKVNEKQQNPLHLLSLLHPNPTPRILKPLSEYSSLSDQYDDLPLHYAVQNPSLSLSLFPLLLSKQPQYLNKCDKGKVEKSDKGEGEENDDEERREENDNEERGEENDDEERRVEDAEQTGFLFSCIADQICSPEKKASFVHYLLPFFSFPFEKKEQLRRSTCQFFVSSFLTSPQNYFSFLRLENEEKQKKRSKDGKTLFHLFFFSEKIDLSSSLLFFQNDQFSLDERDEEGNGAFFYFLSNHFSSSQLQNKHFSILMHFLSHQVSLDRKNKRGTSPLSLLSQDPSQKCFSLAQEKMEKGSIWSYNNHCFFPPSFKKETLIFLLICKSFSKRKKIKIVFPKIVTKKVLFFLSFVTPLPTSPKRKLNSTHTKKKLKKLKK